jgi:hypothetical protein
MFIVFFFFFWFFWFLIFYYLFFWSLNIFTIINEISKFDNVPYDFIRNRIYVLFSPTFLVPIYKRTQSCYQKDKHTQSCSTLPECPTTVSVKPLQRGYRLRCAKTIRSIVWDAVFVSLFINTLSSSLVSIHH